MQTDKSTKDQIIELIGQLETMPAEIAGLREEANHKAEIADLKESIARLKFEAVQIAGTVVDEATGKKMFPNADAREVQAMRVLANEVEYLTLVDSLEDLESQSMNAAIKLDTAEKVFSAKKYALSALTEILRGENNEKSLTDTFRTARLEHEHNRNKELADVLSTVLETLKKSYEEL